MLGIPKLIAGWIAKAVTARLVKKMMGRITILVLRHYAKSKDNELLDSVVDTIEEIIIKGK